MYFHIPKSWCCFTLVVFVNSFWTTLPFICMSTIKQCENWQMTWTRSPFGDLVDKEGAISITKGDYRIQRAYHYCRIVFAFGKFVCTILKFVARKISSAYTYTSVGFREHYIIIALVMTFFRAKSRGFRLL